jgi:hypothetical protein
MSMTHILLYVKRIGCHGGHDRREKKPPRLISKKS